MRIRYKIKFVKFYLKDKIINKINNISTGTGKNIINRSKNAMKLSMIKLDKLKKNYYKLNFFNFFYN